LVFYGVGVNRDRRREDRAVGVLGDGLAAAQEGGECY
jgi:hypothetical protein